MVGEGGLILSKSWQKPVLAILVFSVWIPPSREVSSGNHVPKYRQYALVIVISLVLASVTFCVNLPKASGVPGVHRYFFGYPTVVQCRSHVQESENIPSFLQDCQLAVSSVVRCVLPHVLGSRVSGTAMKLARNASV